MFSLEKLHLAPPYAMLARRGALHGQSPAYQPIIEGPAARDLFLIVNIAKQLHVKISISHMAHDGTEQAALRHIALGLDDTFRQARDRHTNVGRKCILARHQRLGGPESIVPRLPEPGPVLFSDRPFETA